jgi:large subunit ribosomal protein L35
VARKNGRLKRRRAGHNHFLEKKTPQQKRRLNAPTDLTRSDEKKLKRMLGER